MSYAPQMQPLGTPYPIQPWTPTIAPKRNCPNKWHRILAKGLQWQIWNIWGSFIPASNETSSRPSADIWQMPRGVLCASGIRSAQTETECRPNRHALRDELSWTHDKLLIKVENGKCTGIFPYLASIKGYYPAKTRNRLQMYVHYYKRKLMGERDNPPNVCRPFRLVYGLAGLSCDVIIPNVCHPFRLVYGSMALNFKAVT